MPQLALASSLSPASLQTRAARYASEPLMPGFHGLTGHRGGDPVAMRYIIARIRVWRARDPFTRLWKQITSSHAILENPIRCPPSPSKIMMN